MQMNSHLPETLLEENLPAQLRRVRRFALVALTTPGARMTGLVMLVFAPKFASWFLEGVKTRDETRTPSPFTYTLQ
jgi:hypothetical protein